MQLREGALKNRTFWRLLSVWLAILALAASSLACLTGDDDIDVVLFPGDYYEKWLEEHPLDQPSEQHMAEQQDPAQPSAPQGEFVAPAAPVVPQAQPEAPQGVAPAPASPVITAIDFPNTIPANGVTYYGWVSFTDADGDTSRLRLHVLHSTTPMSDWEGKPGTLEGTTAAGKYRIGFYCTIPSVHTMQVTLMDAAGHSSNTMDFSWECQ